MKIEDKRKLGCTRCDAYGEHPKNCKCTTAFKNPDKVKMGKTSRKQGKAFEQSLDKLMAESLCLDSRAIK